MSSWHPFNHGQTIGTKSPEGGVIVRDEEHLLGARITLKEAGEYIRHGSKKFKKWTQHLYKLCYGLLPGRNEVARAARVG